MVTRTHKCYYIQHIKAGQTNVPRPKVNELKKAGIHYVMRGLADQIYDRTGNLLPVAVEHVFYYACFPDLQRNGADINLAVETTDKQIIINPDKKEIYKNKVKAVLELMLTMANANKEAIDIATPNAFFYGLKPRQAQQDAKTLFAEAVLEYLSKENTVEKYPDVPFVSLHYSKMMTEKLEEYKGIKIPILLNIGDASGPQRAAKNRRCGFKVAESLMGNATSAVGNAAMGNRAMKGKEENDTRVCPSIPLVLSQAFNPHIPAAIHNGTRLITKKGTILMAAIKAIDNYLEWSEGKVSHRGPNGWFTWFRHGENGRINAIKLRSSLRNDEATKESMIQSINNFLNNPDTNFNQHSLASFLLDELSALKEIPLWQDTSQYSDYRLYEPEATNCCWPFR